MTRSSRTVATRKPALIGRITKTWEGLARTAFTTADHYVVQIHKELQDPLRSLVVASALSPTAMVPWVRKRQALCDSPRALAA